MQRKNARASAKDFFDANAKNFIKFGKAFISNLTDEELISELAHKDLKSSQRFLSSFLSLSGKIRPTSLRIRRRSLSRRIPRFRRRTNNEFFPKTGAGASPA